MARLIDGPGPRSGPDTVFATIALASGETRSIAANTKLYSALENAFRFHSAWSIENAGQIWNISSADVGVAVNAWYMSSILNTGLIVSEASRGDAWAISAGGGIRTIDNEGGIYAIGGASATAIDNWDPAAVLNNAGTIAAYSPRGGATGVALYNGGLVTNEAGGSILAEGLSATAVIFSRGHAIDPGLAGIRNYGRIEARATDADRDSHGIVTAALDSEIMEVENSGIIRADVAYVSYSEYGYSPPQQARDEITNFSAGQIFGLIDTRLGADTVVNRGLIRGELRMGHGDDVVNSVGGRLVGKADLGWGNDQFRGGNSADAVLGGRDTDVIDGGGGDDLLLGGLGDDRLSGGAGNDGLFGEYGDDHIVAAGGDRVVAGQGDDTIELGDLRFASVDGGAGLDTLLLPAGPGSLDLSAVAASGRVADVEVLATRGGQRIVLRADDVTGLSGGETLMRLMTRASDTIELVGDWTERAEIVVDGIRFRRFVLDGETVLVAGSAGIAVLDEPSAPAAGLGEVAAGADAPTPETVPGMSLSATTTILRHYYLHETAVVQSYEIWKATAGAPVIEAFNVDASLINHGHIESVGARDGVQKNTIMGDLDRIENHGTIRAAAVGGYHAQAILVGSAALTNYGLIEARAEAGSATGVSIGRAWHGDVIFDNHGTIRAVTDGTYRAVGASVGREAEGYNRGTIEAIGGDRSLGLAVGDQQRFENSGSITADLVAGVAGSTIAVSLGTRAMTGSTFVNSGLIRGTRAIVAGDLEEGWSIRNTGRVEGSVELGDGTEMFENDGVVVGMVKLGAGIDLWNGAEGTIRGAVLGGSGSDMLVGSARADSLRGDAGDDYVHGGAGADRLLGGSGRDIFAYMAASDSSAAAFDTIADFSSGADRVDLSALDVRSISFTSGGGYTQLIVEAADGTLSIRVSGDLVRSDLVLSRRALLEGTASDDMLIAAPEGSSLAGGAGHDLMIGSAGNDRFDGGTGVDVAWGGAGNDIYLFDGAGDRFWEMDSEGTDTVIYRALHGGVVDIGENIENLVMQRSGAARGNRLANEIRGSAGNDLIMGAAGDDVLEGGGGNDRLMGDRGRDSLTGGDGSDQFCFDLLPGDPLQADRVLDFDRADDEIQLANAVFGGMGQGRLAASAFRVGTEAADADDRILYDRSTGSLWYDADGVGATAPILFATVEGGPVLTSADFVIY